MYTSFYGLKAKPFQISTDPTFLWLGEKHREAISMLKYGIQGEGHTGILLLTGDVGTGKTTLINALFKSLDKRVIRVCITNPNLEGLDFLNYIAAAYGSKREFRSKSNFLIHFGRFLRNANAKNRKVLLVVDEAQLLSHTLLEEIRLFSNIEKEGQSLIHTFLVGQHELRQKLSRPENRALRQRITLNYNIDALVLEETDEYIRYRLQVAGTSKRIFTPDAVQSIHRYARGLPRKINILCDHALLTGFVQNLEQIGAPIVNECAKDLSIAIVPENKQAAPQKPIDEETAEPVPVAPDTQTASNRMADEHQNHITTATLEKKKNRQILFFAAIAIFVLLAFTGFLLFL
ncbi:MAG: AAA family ATPase [Proteobacteria bacterium]|nr:AAA family ATPase [Pseudomonadota bacterium]